MKPDRKHLSEPAWSFLCNRTTKQVIASKMKTYPKRLIHLKINNTIMWDYYDSPTGLIGNKLLKIWYICSLWRLYSPERFFWLCAQHTHKLQGLCYSSFIEKSNIYNIFSIFSVSVSWRYQVSKFVLLLCLRLFKLLCAQTWTLGLKDDFTHKWKFSFVVHKTFL